MTYREKLKNSTVVKTMLLPKSYFGIVTSKKRRNSVIAFLFIAAYTILNKFVFNTIDHFDFMYVVLVVNLISLFILKMISKSIFELNHYKLYSFVFFISRLCKIIIFVSVFLETTTYFLVFFEKYYIDVLGNPPTNIKVNLLGYDISYFNLLLEFEGKFINEIVISINEFIKNGSLKFDNIKELFVTYGLEHDIFKFIYREIQIVLIIPVVLYFLSINITYIFRLIKWYIIAAIPIYNIVYYFKWLFSANITFDRFSECEDKKFIKKEVMLLNNDTAKDLKTQVRALKFLYSIFALAVMVGVVYGIYNFVTVFSTVVYYLK